MVVPVLQVNFYFFKQKKFFEGEEDVDYAFEMSSSTLRFGKGVTKEIGYDVLTFGAKNPLIVTDKNVAKTVAFE